MQVVQPPPLRTENEHEHVMKYTSIKTKKSDGQVICFGKICFNIPLLLSNVGIL